MSTDKLWTVISGIEYQLNILKDKLKNFDEETKQSVDEAYQRGYDKGYADKSNNDEVGKELAKDIYQKGLDAAWEAARKIVTWPDRSLVNSDTFDLDPGENIFTKYSASEAIAKLKAYEEQKADDEIKVGDEMKQVTESGTETGLRCAVTAIDGDCMSGFSQDGRAIVCSSQVNRWWKKTGRHFDIKKLLEEMHHES